LDGIYYCPQSPCLCRKPSPGMLLRAAQEHQIELTSSWMVGDSESDIEAGKLAGCNTVRITADLPARREGADCFARSLLEAARVLTGGQSGTISRNGS
jgi:histidinol phosphatase-like enzyme